MPRLLIVEDSHSFSHMVAQRVSGELGFRSVVTTSYAETAELLARDTDFFAALLDLNLPDAPHGDIVDIVNERGIPSIACTGEVSDELRQRIWAKGVADYVLKQGEEDVDYIIALLSRLHKNPGVKVLVVDDSRSARHMLTRLLRTHRYQVLEAANGVAALAMAAEDPEIRVVITDYTMPAMDGFELTRGLRRLRGPDDLAIIGLSTTESRSLSARFLKSGANDFLRKPFLTEEFFTRVTQNVELLERIASIRELANRDFLTRLGNRRHFFTAGQAFLDELRAAGRQAVLGVLDIDRFKTVNDTWGHEGGDTVLVHFAGMLLERFGPEAHVARLGGEEFCVLAPDLEEAQALESFEAFRAHCAQNPARFGDGLIPFTVSAGLCSRPGPTLDDMLRLADRALYASKACGRNCVTLAEK